MLSLNPDNYICETKLNLQRVPRNHEPTLQHFEVPQEYVRALNATKLEQVFANHSLLPWTHPESLANILSRACDGDRLKFGTSLDENILVQCKHIKVFLYREYVLTFVGLHFFTVDDDKTAKQWKMDGPSYGEEEEPLPTILGKIAYTGIDHHWKKAVLPHVDSNCSDRNIALYDMRKNKYNFLEPFGSFCFYCSKNYSLYTFDMHALDILIMVHMHHVSAVLDVGYSPTGKEFVSASFDKSIQIFPVDKNRNEEKLKEKLQHHPHIKRISHHQHLPKLKPGSVQIVSDKKKYTVAVVK
ncbi:hypothetical protein FD754_014431 [Muntiacus muntjak]|uniref:Sof1-like protein domain-containing protein n=1 Tax=Muntiacus muntjak TaxID=9888 RepID=A0A5N3VKD2_MUNMU|nr:hypothetical protein FD754_014431 [Muntiacus muntjak]